MPSKEEKSGDTILSLFFLLERKREREKENGPSLSF